MSIFDVRQRIDALPNRKLRIIAQFQLETAARLSEVVGKYAIRKPDLTLTTYKGHDLALFTLKTAKRQGIHRIVALPRSNPRVQNLVAYFQSRKSHLFRYGPSSVRHLLADALNDFSYFIERYTPKKGVVVGSHERSVCTHALRHLRLSELVNVYGFDAIDLATFAGWKMKGMAGRYVTSAWGRYIDKLLKVT